MDKLIEHGIRMLEIVEGENDFFRNDAKRQADIARAVYDVILRVQALERKADRKTETQTELVNDSPILVKDLVDDEFNPYDEECMRCKHLKLQCEFVPSYCKYEPRDEPQADYDKGLKLFADILFDKEKSGHFLKECKAIGIDPQTDCSWK